jgi:hypothetical protein
MTVAGIHLFAVIPAVSELAPAFIGRGGYPSEGRQPGFPIKNVENDEEEKFR